MNSNSAKSHVNTTAATGRSSGSSSSKMPGARLEELALAGGDVNPLKSDPELVTLLKSLDRIKKYKKFQGWRAKFLERLEMFLYEAGMTPAQKACNDFDDVLKKFVKRATKVTQFIDKGELSNTKKTVKAALALNEMCNSLTTVITEVRDLIPYRGQEEKKRGFTKFHLGAVLIRQNFHQYITMKVIEDAVQEISHKAEDVADRQQHDLMADYIVQVQRFCDIMADLGLYEVMMKCLEFAEEPDDESEEPEPINIVIKTHDGKTMRLELEATETIGNIREAIAPGCEIEPERQVLKFQDQEIVDNNKTLQDLGIVEGSILYVSPFMIPITVKCSDGKVIETMVDPKNKLGLFKVQLEDESSIPANDQKISINGIVLENDKSTIEFYGIRPGAVLFLEPKTIKITVEMPDGDEHEMEISPMDTGDDIKNKIEEVTGMATPRQVLMFDGNELPDDAPVAEVGIQKGSTIKVEVFKVPITATTMDGQQIKAMVDPTAKLRDIKVQLENESGIPADNQSLFHDGDELDDDDKAAEDYGIQAGTELALEPKSIKVKVEMPDGQARTIDLKPSETSDDIKTKIEKATGMTVPRQVLKVDGAELPPDQTVKDMGIREGTAIKVEVFKVPITVTTMDGQEIKAMIDPTAKLGDIKAQLENESGIPTDNQNLFLNDDVLDGDGKTAADHGIQAGSELYLEPKSIKINIETPDGKQYEMQVKPSDTTKTLKAQIAKETGVSAPRQVLKVKGEELPSGDKTVKDMGIRDGTTIQVEIFKVPITVTTMDGKQIKVMVDPTHKLRDIKVQLENESGEPAGNQKLFMNGNELSDDDKTAGDYGIQTDSELDLEPKSIKVMVEMPDGKELMLEVAPSDNSKAIKAKVEEQTGMATPRQVLKVNGTELPNDQSVKDMGIRDGSRIKVEVFKVPIKVTTMYGKEINVMVEPSQKLRDIKVQLEEESSEPADNQKLFLNGTELTDDNETAEECGIEAGSELDLEPKSIKVTVEMPNGKEHTVEVTPSDTSDLIKAKIEAETGMASPRQLLTANGKELPSDKTVKDMGIRDGSKIKVEVFKVPVKVTTIDGKVIDVMVDPTDNLGDIKAELEAESGIPADNQKLFMNGKELVGDDKSANEHGIQPGSELYLEPKSMNVTIEMPDGKELTLEVTPSDTSKTIKAKIEEETGMAAPRQVLKVDGGELPNDQTVKDLGVRDGSRIKVEVFKVPIKVMTMDGKEIDVMIEPSAKLRDIKVQLEEESGEPADNQKLFLNGNELPDDEKTAEECGIKDGSELDLEPKSIKVTVEMPDGKEHSLDVTPSDTYKTIKDKLAKETGLAAPRQVLKVNGTELPNNKTVKDMGIRDGSRINVEVFKVPITVMTIDGKVVEVMVEPGDKLGDIKSQLEEESGIPADNQKLFMNGDELLDDNKTAEEHGIKPGSELYLEPKSISVTVEMPDGTEHTLQVKPSDNSQAIKAKIEAATGMVAPRQVLKVDGEELPVGKTIKDMGIRDGSRIKVEVFKVPVTVKTLDGNAIEAMIDPTDKIKDIKKQLEKESGELAGNQKLFLDGNELADDKTANECGIKAGSELELEPKSIKVSVEMPDGNEHTVEVTPSDDSKAIKAKIEAQTGMVAPRQVLKVDGEELPNGTKAKHMGIRDGSRVKVEVFKVPITVTTMDGKDIYAMVDPTEKIGSIKKQLEKESGVPANNQELLFHGNELEDGMTATASGIKANSHLDLEPKSINVTVEMPDGQERTVKITPSDISKDIKAKIADETGMAVPRQVLKFDGEELPNGRKAKEMGIRDGSKIKVEVFKVPVTVMTMDGNLIYAMVDPTAKLRDIKVQLEKESGEPANNQKLLMNDKELADDDKVAAEYGIKAHSKLDLEPKSMKVSVEMPDGEVRTIGVKPSDTSDKIKATIEMEITVAAPRQVLMFGGKELTSGSKLTAKALGIREGSTLNVGIFKIPITVKTNDGKEFPLDVEPCSTIDTVKKMILKNTGLDPRKQCLKFGEQELADGDATVEGCGIKRNSILTVEPHMDPIIFVDIKCGTLFAMDREAAVDCGILTTNQGNKLDFVEATHDSSTRDKIRTRMKESPTLGVAPQVVVQKGEVEDYDLEEAEKVKSMWGVKLKKREKNKKGEEFIFVDPKTGSTGELSRQQCIDKGFITIVSDGKGGETLKEKETETMAYDKYVYHIRHVFDIEVVT